MYIENGLTNIDSSFIYKPKRQSWDTNVKHYFRLGLENALPKRFKSSIPSSNISRWKREAKNKYKGSEVAEYINQELQLIKRFNQSSNIKNIVNGYFTLCDTLHKLIAPIKNLKSLYKDQKALIVNTVESLRDIIAINDALRVFNISRTTYQTYKTIVIHKCEASYFKWCTKRISNQLLREEVLTIKHYMEHEDYKFWSKSSIYLKAVRDEALCCGLSTFYKYCRLLGFKTLKSYAKQKGYNALKTTMPNEVWCADVTFFKTDDGAKHYIHILMDHFSKKVLGYSIEKSSSGKAIRFLLQQAYTNYKPKSTIFLTDAGSENLNNNVETLIHSLNNKIIHRIAQRDVLFSNSMIEAFNKVLKYQFLHPKSINSGKQLKIVLGVCIQIYNHERPQWNLGGNTPNETFLGVPINKRAYTTGLKTQQSHRITQNKVSICKTCL